MVDKDSFADDFEIVQCPRCGTNKVDVMDFEEYNQVLIFKCSECGEEFTKPVKMAVL